MRNLITAFALVLTAQSVFGNLLLNRLDRLYEKDQSKCLKRSKWYIKQLEHRAEPYFYAFRIQTERARNSNNAISAFYRTRTALNYANGFNQRADDKLKNELGWNSFSEIFAKDVRSVILMLESENEEEFADLLSKRLDKFHDHSDNNNGVLNVAEKRIESVDRADEFAFVNQLMFNMPTGAEIIPSSNLSREVELLEIINKYREEKGLDPLIWNEELANAARYHAFDLGSQDYFDHDTYDRVEGNLVRVGSTFQRIGKFYDESKLNAENIAAGNLTSQATFDQWYNSVGHFATMFDAESTKAGIGYVRVTGSTYEHYWVLCTAD